VPTSLPSRSLLVAGLTATALVGCRRDGGSPEASTAAPTKVVESTAAGFAPAPLYAALFVDGTTLTYGGRLDTDGPGTPGPIGFTCVVSGVQLAEAQATALFTCDGAGADFSARLGATPAGLYQLDGLSPGDPVERGQLVVSATPTVGATVVQDDEEGQAERVVTREGDGVCVEHRGTIGDSFAVKRCFVGGKPVRLEALFEGGFSRKLVATLGAAPQGAPQPAPTAAEPVHSGEEGAGNEDLLGHVVGQTARDVEAMLGKAILEVPTDEGNACFVFAGQPDMQVCFAVETEQASWKTVRKKNFRAKDLRPLDTSMKPYWTDLRKR
jgi:hypothetical protein